MNDVRPGRVEDATDTLRRAAARIRELAQEATGGPWWVHDANDTDVWWGSLEDIRRVDRGEVSPEEGEAIMNAAGQLSHGDFQAPEDAAFVAAMHPLVAVAFADLLEVQAKLIEFGGAPFDDDETSVDAIAIRAARTFLGDDLPVAEEPKPFPWDEPKAGQ
jgi:hypothetical protein